MTINREIILGGTGHFFLQKFVQLKTKKQKKKNQKKLLEA